MQRYHMKESPLLEDVVRELRRLVDMGLVKKIIEDGEELYTLSFADRAHELLKDGLEPRLAYSQAVKEASPALSTEDVDGLVERFVNSPRSANDSS
jgi:hypothetical protein